jgi:hypothetical protein
MVPYSITKKTGDESPNMCIVSFRVFVVTIPRSGGCEISNNNAIVKLLRVFI